MISATSFCGVEFGNPLILASGVWGSAASSLARAVENGAGGVTVKSLSLAPRAGHPNPTMVGTKTYFLNAVGLSNPGIEAGKEELRRYKELAAAPLIGSIFAGTADEFAQLAAAVSVSPIDLIELDLSCPNVGREFGEPFAYSAAAIGAITRQVKSATRVPVSVKLSPNAWNIAGLAAAAEAAGAEVFKKIRAEMEGIMAEEGIKTLDEIRGAAHRACP